MSQPWFRDYVRLSYPRAVPDDFCGDWVRFVRYRVPSLSSDRHEGEEHGQLRKRRMEAASKSQMTYFILRSAGTGQRFSLVVNREQGEPQREECTPNGYGFCVTSSPFQPAGVAVGIKRYSEPRPLQLSKRANVFYLEHARVVQPG